MEINKNNFLKALNGIERVYIMGHIELDLDALGSAIGLVSILEQLGKKAAIIINDKKPELAVKSVLEKMGNKITFLKGSEVTPHNKDLVIVVDTNKQSIVQDPELLTKIPNRMVIDHHSIGEDHLEAKYIFIDSEASSTCQIIVDLLKELAITLPKEINTILLSGIVLDTNNFVVKTDEKTYYNAYLLTKAGANPTEVQYLLKQDIKNYSARQKVITNVKVYHGLAITTGDSNVRYRREDLAKIADTLLQFKGIEASFVIGLLDENTVGISARSMGNYSVQEIMEKMGGGGDHDAAATKIAGKSLKEAAKELFQIIKER